MNLRAIMLACSFALLAVAAGTPSALDIYNTTSTSHGTSGTMPHMRSVQFDDNDDGVGGCVNECKLKLEICLGQRPDGEPPDRCEKLEDDCENACYNSGPDAGDNT